VTSRAMPAPVIDDRVLAQIEANFLRPPDAWPSPAEIDLAETLGPLVDLFDDDEDDWKTSKVLSRYGGCCA
jgi:hypothetical protein